MNGVVVAFSADAFRKLLARPSIEWSLPHLAQISGVAVRTLHTWLSGSKKPRRAEWELVAATLALEPCMTCGGSGRVETSSPPPPIRGKPIIIQGPPLLAPVATTYYVGGLTVDIAMRQVEYCGRALHLTPVEARIIGTLAASAERLYPSPEIERAVWPTAHGRPLDTNWARLRTKFARIGAADYLVTRSGGPSMPSFRALSAACERLVTAGA